jgi:hypothetical protein
MDAPGSHDERVDRVVDWYEQLTPDTLAQIDRLYARDATFKDPFNEVQGCDAIRAVFEHMYRQVQAPRFVFHETVAQGNTAFLTWTMHYRRSADAADGESIRGCTQLRFGADDLVVLHRDYWDAAEELYEKLPLLGAVMRAIKRRLKA